MGARLSVPPAPGGAQQGAGRGIEAPVVPAAPQRCQHPPGELLTLTYRLWVHRGDASVGDVMEQWRAYATEPWLEWFKAQSEE